MAVAVANAVGTATVDFGTWPGTNETTVPVTGQSAISAGSHAEAFLMAEASGTHTAADAGYAPLWIALTCTVPVAGAGFTINARAAYAFTGTFAIRWVWSD
jgi:hypothetical protein